MPELEDVFPNSFASADFFAFTAPIGQANFSLRAVTDVRIGWSRAAKDTILASADNQLV